MSKLNYYDWTLRIIPNSSEGYCWKKRKIIDVGSENLNIKKLMIHEIAHIDICRFCNNKHHIEFWKKYENLLRKFLPKENIEPKYNENVGYFKKCYDNKKEL